MPTSISSSPLARTAVSLAAGTAGAIALWAVGSHEAAPMPFVAAGLAWTRPGAGRACLRRRAT